ncbi:MAG: YqhA family protein [Deltaproteobacteria bacterium]|nr:YqhA family protein [Deltaproteobacteria bacterium]
MFKKIEKAIEFLLWESRLIVIFAVVSSIVSAFVLVLMGTYDVLLIVKELPRAFSDATHYEHFHKEAITHLISAIDSFLITTVLLIFGIGLYELFISKIDRIESDNQSAKILEIHSLDQLKEKLAKVIIMVLIVTYFKYALAVKYETIQDLLYLGIGIFLIALASYFMNKDHAPVTKKTK